MLSERIKKGIAKKVKVSKPENNFCVIRKRTKSKGPRVSAVKKEERPIPIEIGTPNIKRRKMFQKEQSSLTLLNPLLYRLFLNFTF